MLPGVFCALVAGLIHFLCKFLTQVKGVARDMKLVTQRLATI
jgi:hypothetical protein